MADLKTNLELIKQEKDTKIIPSNIRKDVTIFGVTGAMSEQPHHVHITNIIQEDPIDEVKISYTDEFGAIINPDSQGMCIAYTDKFVINISVNGEAYPAKILNLTGDIELQITIPKRATKYVLPLSENFEMIGEPKVTHTTSGNPRIIASPTTENALYTDGSSYITYTIPTVTNYDLTFNFYKADNGNYSRVIGIFAPGLSANYEIEIKGHENIIYWGSEYQGHWKANAWNKLELKKINANEVELIINGTLIATRNYPADLGGIRIGKGHDNNNYFTGYYKNLKIADATIVPPEIIYDITEVPTEINITPEVTPQAITPNTTKITQINVEAVTAAIDNNILPENIKKGIVILGVTGTLE